MTFLQLQNDVLGRLGLTTPDARTRIKLFINERYRKLQTAIGLDRVRFGTITFPTVNGTNLYSTTGLIKPWTVAIPAQNWVLDESTMDNIRLLDTDHSQTGRPYVYAVQKFNPTTASLYLFPTPDGVYSVQVDGILTGVDLVADADIPAFPEDFHDLLTFAASADELMKMEKPQLAQAQEIRADARTRDLRYFLAKSAYLGLIQAQTEWWWGPWFQSYRG